MPPGACLTLAKPTWSVQINDGIMSVNLLVMALVYILRSKFKREIGLKFGGELGSLPGLGRVMIVARNISDENIPGHAASLNTGRR